MADTTIINLTETTSPTKDDVAVIVDNPSTSTPSNRKITLETLHSKLYSNTVQSVTDGQDVTIKQFDGIEVARIHDGDTNSVTSSGTGGSTLTGGTGKGGFGFRRPVYHVTCAVDDETIELTLQHSGAIIKVSGQFTAPATQSYDMDIKLPAIPLGCEGFHVDIAIIDGFYDTNNLEISTNGASGDKFFLYMNTAGTSGVDVDGGDVITFTNDVPAGTLCRLTCIEGGDAEQWIAEVMQPSGTAATTGTAVG
jgi:hypothetical protein